MPRELVHWRVLEGAIERSDPARHRQILKSVKAQSGAAYLGAIAHDAPYYYNLGGHRFEYFAGVLHGEHGEDTMIPLVRAVRARHDFESAKHSELIEALIAGMVSHAATDIVFHPMVYYFSGNYHDQDPHARLRARILHRLYEVYLDSWIEAHWEFRSGKKISSRLSGLGSSMAVLSRYFDTVLVPVLLGSGAGPSPLTPDVKELLSRSGMYHTALTHMARCQYLFRNAAAGSLVRLLSSSGSGKLKAIDALCNFGRRTPHVFERPIEFLNPVTGAAIKTNAEELLDRAINTCVELWSELEAALQGETEIESRLLAGRFGKSLNYGEYAAPIAQGKYFSKDGLPLA